MAEDLSLEHVRQVQESWKIINTEENGVTMIKRMLTEHPELIPLFSFGKCGLRGDAIFRQPTFARHCRYVMETIDMAVEGLGTRSYASLVPVLKDLGEKHRSVRVQKEHFQYLKEAFVFMLREALGDNLTNQVAESWLILYSTITDTMASRM